MMLWLVVNAGRSLRRSMGCAFPSLSPLRTARRLINRGHSVSRRRKNGLPYDEARQALASHFTRLSNLDKSRLMTAEKSIIDARKKYENGSKTL
nr:hypothetical protein [Bartonella bacilliformis]